MFVEVVRQNGFSRAAPILLTTQSTVSKAVRRLEHELGAPLIDRIGHRITPTEAGEVVYRRASRILAERDTLLTELEDLRGVKVGRLRLGLPPVNTSTIFGPVLALYRNRHPAIEIQCVEQGGELLKGKVLSGEVDLAVALLPVSDEFAWQEVTREPLVAVLPAHHALLGQDSVELASLRHLPFILFASGYSITRVVLEACRRLDFEPTVAAQTCQVELLVELVRSGLGVGFLPRMIAERCAADYVVLAEPHTEWHLAMIWRKDSYLSKAARAWLGILRDCN
jgi:DNA-binding transcriptional LysR family regulator